MPWINGDYPPSMKNLDPRVREKAVEIANALLEDGSEEGRAIAIATDKAKEWAENHPVSESKRSSKKDDDSNNERDQYFKDRAGTEDARFHVVPDDNEGWAVKAEGEDEPEYTTDTKSKAVKEAKRMAEEAGTMAIIHGEDGKIEEQHNYQ